MSSIILAPFMQIIYIYIYVYVYRQLNFVLILRGSSAPAKALMFHSDKRFFENFGFFRPWLSVSFAE